MSIDDNIYVIIVNSLNERWKLQIKLQPSSASIILPQADLQGQIVRFNPKIETLMALFDFSLNHKMPGSQVINHFILYHVFLSKGMYEKADNILRQLEISVRQLSETFNQSSPRISVDTIALQVIFILCHEMSHIYYRYNPEALVSFTVSLKERMDCYLEWVSKSSKIRFLQYLIPGGVRKLKDSFDEAKSNNHLMEEMACDEVAWNVTKLLIRNSEYGRQDQTVFCAHIALVLNFLENYQHLEDYYTRKANELQDHNLRFNSVRHMILGQTIWEWLADDDLEMARFYQKYIRNYEHITRYCIAGSIMANIESAATLCSAKQLPDAKKVRRLEYEYLEIDKSIRELYVK